MSLRFISIKTPLNTLTLIIQNQEDNRDCVVAAGFGSFQELTQRLPKELASHELQEIFSHPYKDAVIAYFSGKLSALDTVLHDQPGSVFSKKVWGVMQSIPPGQTMTYKELAEQSGSPAAVRAAGTVCAQNRLMLLVPCHRIVRSDGETGNYLYGTTIKQSLLQHEAKFSS